MKFILLLFGLLSSQAFALGNFTAQEIADHRRNVRTIVDIASKCLDRVYFDEHVPYWKENGVSKFYGDRREDYDTVPERIRALRDLGFNTERATKIAKEQIGMSCIGLARQCLAEGFYATGTGTTWEKIDAVLKVDKLVRGTDLQIMLIELGWRGYYWNPTDDVEKMKRWDIADKKRNPLTPKMIAANKKVNPVWGQHFDHWLQATRAVNPVYNQAGLKVHNNTLLVGFGDVQPAAFRRAPFFIGIAHAGYHVFPGRRGEVIEAHSKRDIDKFDNLEFSEFNPLKTGGGPRWTDDEWYQSGFIVVPEDI